MDILPVWTGFNVQGTGNRITGFKSKTGLYFSEMSEMWANSERKSSSWHSWVYLWLLWISFEWWSCRSNEYPDTRNDVCVWWQQSAIWSKKSELNMFLPDIFWQKKKAGVVNRPVMYPQSHVPENASKSAVWEHPLDDARTRWARYKLLMWPRVISYLSGNGALSKPRSL